MNQRHLEYFLEVYKHKSIKTVAQQMHITPQGISKTILALEEELEEQLFIRKGKLLIPTQAAADLKHHAQKILEEYALIKSKQYLSNSRKNTLKILSTCDILQYLTVEFIKDFQILHPDILPIFTETTDRIAQQMIHDDEVEIALLPGPIDNAVFSTQFLYSSDYCFVIHESHPLSKKSSISLADLHQQPLAIRGREFSLYDTHQNILSENGVEPVNIIETSNYYIIHSMVEANLCIGSSLDYIAYADPRPNTVILPFDSHYKEKMKKKIYFTHKKKKVLSTEASTFKNFMFDWVMVHRNQLFRWK